MTEAVSEISNIPFIFFLQIILKNRNVLSNSRTYCTYLPHADISENNHTHTHTYIHTRTSLWNWKQYIDLCIVFEVQLKVNLHRRITRKLTIKKKPVVSNCVGNVRIMDRSTRNRCIGQESKGDRTAGEIKWILGKRCYRVWVTAFIYI